MSLFSNTTKLAKLTTLFSFLAGTLLLIIFAFSTSQKFAFFSYGFVWIIAIINVLVLFYLIYKLLKGHNKNEIVKSILLLLINIPIALIYLYIVSFLFNTLRLTIENNSNQTAQNIEIKGCENKKIADLEKGKSETLSIKIPNDCSVSISYTLDSKKEEKTISEYLSTGMGKKIKHTISN